MSKLKQGLKKVLPESTQDVIRGVMDGVGNLKTWPEATFHPWRQESKRKLRSLKDIHKGERCFIIGNGPSLKNTDLSRLKGEYTFGMNRFFLAFPELGFQTTYFICVNDLVIEQTVQEFMKLEIPFFASWRAHQYLKPAENLHFLYTTYTGQKFAKDITGRIWEGATVTYSTLQLAYYMGFKQAILIGVDHNFQSKGTPNTTIVSQGDDQDHFHPAYFGKGFRWQLPDLETSERSYRLAKKTYEEDGREVIDATVGGKLTVFRKVAYDSLFDL